MKLIKITDNILVNPEKISSIEFMMINEARNLIVTIEGRQIVSTVTPSELLTDLAASGIGTDSKLWQYWAG